MILSCDGCVTYTKFPDIPVTKTQPSPVSVPVPVKQEPQKECTTLAMPDPPPKVIHITREPGTKTKVDAGGLKLLQDYTDLRLEIKKAWYSKP